MTTAAPEQMIRRHLDEHGSTTATVDHLLTSFQVAPEDPLGRERIVSALAQQGVVVDRPLSQLDPDAQLTIALAATGPPPPLALPSQTVAYPPPPAEASPPPPMPEGPPPPAPTSGQLLSTQPGKFWLTALAAALMVVGSLGPWATALGVVSVSGTRGDGWIVIGAAGLALAMLWRYAVAGARGGLIVGALAGIAGFLVGAVDLSDISSKGSNELFGEQVQLIQPAWGIYLVVAASAALAILSLVLRASSRPNHG